LNFEKLLCYTTVQPLSEPLREREPGPHKGFFDIDKLTYVLQFGAGVW
jgi:hypothetical protein